MVKWQVILAKQAVKDAKKISRAGFKSQADELLKILETNPFQNPPHYEKLTGNLSGFYSRRITIQHRLVYDIDKEKKIVHVLKMWTHYE